MRFQAEELLMLTKTYPEPSVAHRETTCVAALTRSGQMRRIFPVPFRFLGGNSQFQKWEWLTANLIKAPKDHRPESYKIDVDSIERPGEKVDTSRQWRERLTWLAPHTVESFAALEDRRLSTGETLGVLKVNRLLQLEISRVREPDWTEDEKRKLSAEGLFDSDEIRNRPPLRKLPHSFHYHYECSTEHGVETNRHKITDWEAGALYWNCVRSHGTGWEKPFRQKLEAEFSKKNLMLLMGTIHRFPDQWLIVGLFYPPKQPGEPQRALFD